MSFEYVSSVTTPGDPCIAFNTIPSHTIHKHNLVALSLKSCSQNLHGDPLQIPVWQQMEVALSNFCGTTNFSSGTSNKIYG